MSETATPSPGEVADAPPSSSSDTLGDSLAADHGDSTHSQRPTPANGEASSPEAKPTGREHKRLSPYERAKRLKATLRQRESEQNAAWQKRDAELRSREEKLSKAEKPKYTLAELKEYRPAWARDAQEDQWDTGKAELLKRADAEIARLEKEEADQVAATKQTLELPAPGTPEHEQQWRAMEAQIAQDDPDFMKEGTELDTEIRKLLSGPYRETYRRHPQGIYAAWADAKRIVLSRENQALRAELKRLTGLTSIGGGAPGKVGANNGVENLKDFSRLSSAEMLKHLRSKRSGSMSMF